MSRISVIKPGHVYAVDLGDGEPVIINFQSGPVKEVGVNGVQNEDLLEILIDRLEYLQAEKNGMFACKENKMALLNLKDADKWQKARTAKRVSRGVEGTNKP